MSLSLTNMSVNSEIPKTKTFHITNVLTVNRCSPIGTPPSTRLRTPPHYHLQKYTEAGDSGPFSASCVNHYPLYCGGQVTAHLDESLGSGCLYHSVSHSQFWQGISSGVTGLFCPNALQFTLSLSLSFFFWHLRFVGNFELERLETIWWWKKIAWSTTKISLRPCGFLKLFCTVLFPNHFQLCLATKSTFTAWLLRIKEWWSAVTRLLVRANGQCQIGVDSVLRRDVTTPSQATARLLVFPDNISDKSRKWS